MGYKSLAVGWIAIHSISCLLQNIVSETKATRGSLHSLIDHVIVTNHVMTGLDSALAQRL